MISNVELSFVKKIAILGIFICAIQFMEIVCATTPAYGQTVPQYQTDPVDKLIQDNSLKTPKDLESYVLKNFRYKSDKQDKLKSVERFLEDGNGDCEDYAYFIGNVLNKMGYDSKILWLEHKTDKNVKIGHRVAIFEDKEGWHYMDGFTNNPPTGDAKISKPYKSPQELASDYFRLAWGVGSPNIAIDEIKNVRVVYECNPNLGYSP